METLIVLLIVALATFFMIRRLYRGLKTGESACGCSCSACPTLNDCNGNDSDPKEHSQSPAAKTHG